MPALLRCQTVLKKKADFLIKQSIYTWSTCHELACKCALSNAAPSLRAAIHFASFPFGGGDQLSVDKQRLL